MFTTRQWLAGLVLASALPCSFNASAQDYPAKQPIKIIVAQGAGSATDIMARVLAARLPDALGQQLIVDNKPGAGGLLGTELAAKSPADGYTLFLASVSSHGVNPAIYKQLPYDPIKDFIPISMTGVTGNVLVVDAKLPFKTLPELIEYAKKNPDVLTYGTPGEGSSQHLATALLARMAGDLKMLHVPYKGTAPMLTAVMSGETAWAMPAIPSGMPAIKSGKVRPLAVTTLQRHRDLPDVPTVAETLPGYEVATWYGLAAPAGTPAPVIAQLNAAVIKTLANEETIKNLETAGLDPKSSRPGQFADFIKAEISKWSQVAKAANITLD
jgi:tripartite-type tricarboxylate transporter receptor subunit TctC